MHRLNASGKSNVAFSVLPPRLERKLDAKYFSRSTTTFHFCHKEVWRFWWRHYVITPQAAFPVIKIPQSILLPDIFWNGGRSVQCPSKKKQPACECVWLPHILLKMTGSLSSAGQGWGFTKLSLWNKEKIVCCIRMRPPPFYVMRKQPWHHNKSWHLLWSMSLSHISISSWKTIRSVTLSIILQKNSAIL